MELKSKKHSGAIITALFGIPRMGGIEPGKLRIYVDLRVIYNTLSGSEEKILSIDELPLFECRKIYNHAKLLANQYIAGKYRIVPYSYKQLQLSNTIDYALRKRDGLITQSPQSTYALFQLQKLIPEEAKPIKHKIAEAINRMYSQETEDIERFVSIRNSKK